MIRILMLCAAGCPAAGVVRADLLWSDLFAGLPAGADAVVPPGETVIFDAPSADIGALTVMGRLVFEDDEDISLTARRIMVMGGGAEFRAGSLDTPFVHRLTITLAEQAAGAEPAMGFAVLGAMDGGSIRLHGASATKRSWTQLSADVPAGGSVLPLIDQTAWQPGDELVIAASGEDPRDTERAIVQAVSADGRTITLDRPLSHPRLGRVFEYGGKPLDMRAEVGLLSRNIVIRSPQDAWADEKGWHGMFMPDAGPIRLEGVEMVGGGRIAEQGRYPIHWHRDPAMETHGPGRNEFAAVDRSGDFVRGCSIHTGFQRGVVLHGVNSVLVEGVVVADVFNHAFTFSEHGHEIRNVLRDNLAVLVKRRPNADFAFPRTDHTESDQAEHRPSGFWGRNPFNEMTGNHAAGTVEGIGFFIDSQLMPHSIKQLIRDHHSVSETVVFRDNLSHSNYRENVAGAGIPTYGPKTRAHGLMVGDYNGYFEAVYEGFETYQNSVSGVWIEDDRHTLRDTAAADSSIGFFVRRSTVEDAVFNQQSDNTLGRGPQVLGNRRTPGGGVHFEPTSYGFTPTLRGVTFINTEPAAAVVWQDPFDPEVPGADTAVFEGITLLNTPAVLHHADWAGIDGVFHDADGSLTGLGAGTRIGGAPLLAAGGFYEPASNTVFVPGACAAADLAEPLGMLDLSDVTAFASAFLAGEPAADLAEPAGVLDVSDISAFVGSFAAGCP